MPTVWISARGATKFYSRGIKLYPESEMYKEMSFISYYFHWQEDVVLSLEHSSRRKWCQEISTINASINPSKKDKEKNIFEIKPSR